MTILGSFVLAKDISNFNLGDWLGVTSNIVLILAVYSLVFKKQILSTKWWKVIFWIMIVNLVIEFEPSGILNRVLSFMQGNVTKASTGEMIFQFIVAIPAFYATYKLSYKK